MSGIRAFVGHSFAKEDVDVVDKFLKYFEQLSQSPLDFLWEHAEAAEPKDVAEKVMRRLAGKNTFIGICTKNERIVSSDALKRSFLRRNVFNVDQGQIGWKTSDWIIQEIGLAIGRGLELILFVEQGVRRPGDLQGNIERIPFERTSPEQSFGRFVEMLTALSPKVTAAEPATESSPAEPQKKTEPIRGEEWTTPRLDWTLGDYDFALMHFIATGNKSGAAAITQAYLGSEYANEPEGKERWSAQSEYLRIFFGKGGNLEDLKAMAAAHPTSSEILSRLAQAYVHYKEYAKAAIAFEDAAKQAKNESEIWLFGEAAEQYTRAGLISQANAVVVRLKLIVEKREDRELQLLKILKNIAQLTKEDDTLLAILERIIELTPGDVDTRFSLALKHSESGSNDLALFHYLKIPDRERAPETWNNLGVAFDRLALKAKSVSAFRDAADRDETLAMSNLARSFISAGFLPEANAQCEKALAVPNYHKNIGHDLARLRDLPDEENKKEFEILEKAKPKSEFLAQLGRAASCRQLDLLLEHWQAPECVLTVTLADSQFSAVGSYELEPSGIRRTFAGFAGMPGIASIPERFRMEFSGTVKGHAIEGRVKRTREGEIFLATSLLNVGNDGTKVLMFLGGADNEIRVMENPQDASPKFYTLTQQRSVS